MNELQEKSLVAVILLAHGSAAAQSAAAPPTDAPMPSEAVATENPRRAIDARAAVRLALRNSPTLSAATSQYQSAKYDVLGEQGRYQFVFQADASYTQAASPRLQPEDVVMANTSRSALVGAQLSRTFAFGMTSSLRVQGERFENSFGFNNPLLSQASGFGLTSRLTLTQPLLRGAGTTVGRVELHAAESNLTFKEKSERRVASQLVRDVLTAYWELWYASEAVAIERQSFDLALGQERDANARVARGALAPADALTFATRVAELQESLVMAESTEKAKALELLRLTGAGDSSSGSESWAALAPPEGLVTPSRDALQRALQNDSIELAELEAQVETARVRAEVAGDALRPRLDVDGYLETKGLGIDPDSATGRAAQFGWVAGHVGLTFELPTDDTRKDAQRQSALWAVSTAQANLKTTRDKLATDAALGAANAAAAELRLVLAQRTLDLAQKTFEAARGRYELGLSIPMQVQEADDDVRRAKLRQARARVDLANQQTALQHLSGDLLRQYGG